MKRTKALGLMIGLVVLLALVLLSRNSFLQWMFKRQQAHLKTAYHLDVSIAGICFSSWNTVHLSGLCIQPEGADTLAMFQNLELKPALLPLLTGHIKIKALVIDSAAITAFNLPGRSNLLFLKTDKQKTQIHSTRAADYYTTANDLKGRFLNLLNTAFKINNLHVSYCDTAVVERVYVPQLMFDRQTLLGTVINEQRHDTLTLSAGVIEPDRAFKLSITHPANVLSYLPFLDAAHGFKCRFKSLTATVRLNDAGGVLQIMPDVQVSDFHVQHWRLAQDDVVFPLATFNGSLKISARGFELDSTSTITLNHAGCKVFAAYYTQPDTIIALNIHMPETVSDTFFNALPGGMFNTLKGISCSGTLSYNLQFLMNTQQPDSLVFESQLKRKDFHINHYGAENYERINQPFVYDAYSGGVFVRPIIVGPENPSFTPYNHIATLLPATIMQSEDPSFMVHRGFVPEAFRESIAQNFKEKRFARGGSTISMQLVKNVFLTHNKTVSRKAEEALIVYLIENLGLVPKERMMEVYLNVIEWGPNVYGVNEAARFYFNKKPADLTLQQCIFLAAIIPNPKYFKYQFDKSGEIKPYMADFFRIIAGRLVLRGYLTYRDTINFKAGVKLTGPALKMVVPADSVRDFSSASFYELGIVKQFQPKNYLDVWVL